jgi:hypothetical protein
MIPGKYDIEIYRGSTWTINVSKRDANDIYLNFEDAYINQPAAGLGEIRMYIRPAWRGRPGDVKPEPLLELTTANGRITVSTTVLTLTIPASVTETLSFIEGLYDIECVTGDAEPVVDKILAGSVAVKDESTVPAT